MRKILFPILFVTIGVSAFGQSDHHKDTLTIDEVVVTSKHHVRQGIDGDVYTPSSRLKENASDGLQLLSMLKFPGLTVDLLQKTISYIRSGEVQVRINHVVSSEEDLLSLHPGNIKNVCFITMPGQKYGNAIALVIDVIAKRGDLGLDGSLSTMDALTANYHDESIWAKKSGDNSEFELRYNFKANSNSKVYTSANQKYVTPTSGSFNAVRDGKYSNSTFTSHDIQFNFNHQSSDQKRIYDIKLDALFSGFPHRRLYENIAVNNSSFTTLTDNKNRKFQPTAKVYFSTAFDSVSSMNVYIAGAYIRSRYSRGFETNEIDEKYKVRGNKYSLHGEVNYDRTLSSVFNISAGLQYDASNTRNAYYEGNSSIYNLHSDWQLAYAETSMSLKAFQLQASVGISRSHNSIAQSSYTFWTVKPKLNALYKITEWLSANYKFERTPELPVISDMTDFHRRDDLWDVTVGNPDLQPYNVNSNEMKVSLDFGNTYCSIIANYDFSRNIIFTTSPTWDGDSRTFIWSTDNGAKYRHFQLSAYGEQYLFNRKLFFYVMPYYTHDLFKAKGSYSHNNSIFAVKSGMSLYLKRLTFDFDYDSPSEILKSETVYRNLGTTNACLSYRTNRFSVKLGVRNAFNHKGSGRITERISDIAYKYEVIRNHAFSNMVYLSLSWNFLQSKTHRKSNGRVVSTSPNLDDGIVR